MGGQQASTASLTSQQIAPPYALSNPSRRASASLRIRARFAFKVALSIEVARNTHLVAEEGRSDIGGLLYMHWQQFLGFTAFGLVKWKNRISPTGVQSKGERKILGGMSALRLNYKQVADLQAEYLQPSGMSVENGGTLFWEGKIDSHAPD
jgi:hypothetical protein